MSTMTIERMHNKVEKFKEYCDNNGITEPRIMRMYEDEYSDLIALYLKDKQFMVKSTRYVPKEYQRKYDVFGEFEGIYLSLRKDKVSKIQPH